MRDPIPSPADMPEGSRWTFTDHREAFPFLPLGERIVDEINISLSAAGGGTHGAFTIEFIDLGAVRPAPRLKIFSDGWAAAQLSGLLSRLAADPEAFASKDQVKALLLDIGMVDETARYRSKREEWFGVHRRLRLEDLNPSSLLDWEAAERMRAQLDGWLNDGEVAP
jgi:hypothetical protein